MRPIYTRERSMTGTPNATSSPLVSPLNRHARAGSTGVPVKKTQQTKAAAARLAAMMSHKSSGDDEGEDDDNSIDLAVGSGSSSIGFGGARSVRPRSPMTGAMANRMMRVSGSQGTLNDDSDDDDLMPESTSGKVSIGLGGRAVRPSSPMARPNPHFAMQRVSQAAASQPANDDNDENDTSSDYYSTFGSKNMGRAGAKSMRSRTPLTGSLGHAAVQKPGHSPSNQSAGDDNDEDEDYGLMSGTPSIGLGGARPMRGRSPMSVHAQPEQPPSARSTSIIRPLKPVKTVEQPLSARSTLHSQSAQSTTSILDQPPSARSLAAGRPNLGVKAVPLVPATVQISLRPPSSAIPSGSPLNRRDNRSSFDLGSMNIPKESDSVPVLQDEIDMLQEENGSLLEKLRLAEERCEEAEARAEQLAKQVANLGEGVSMEARLLSRKEAALQQREAALKVIAQSGGSRPEEIVALRSEAETARNEAVSAFEDLTKAYSDIKALQNMTKRMILTQEEMEEVVMKRCWLSRYWSLCINYGIHSEIAKAKHEYWSCFAPLPVDVVLAAGQRAKEGFVSDTPDAQQREKAFNEAVEVSGEGNIESMLQVEKGLRELSSLKVQEAVALVMAHQRRSTTQLKFGMQEEVKLPIEGQYEAFELTQEEAEDVRFKQAWLMYFWRRAKEHEIEPDLADDRLEFWINHSLRSTTSHDAVDVERGLLELKKLNIESQLWQESRKGLEAENAPKPQLENDF